MRINKYVALATGLSRRAADSLVEQGKIAVKGITAGSGLLVEETDKVTLEGQVLTIPVKSTIIMHKPRGYVVSRNGQGSKTVYDLLPAGYRHLKPVGRLDKDSSGLLLMTNDGNLANELTHPNRQKIKIYEIIIDKPLQPLHHQMISDIGIQLKDGVSKLLLERIEETNDLNWRVTMTEGRNRQIRRTFEALGYTVRQLHRTHFGPYTLNKLQPGKFTITANQ